MSTEILKMVQSLEQNSVCTQLAVQCAPLLAGVKMSNLLIIAPKELVQIHRQLRGTGISSVILAADKDKVTLLLYRAEELSAYLQSELIQKFLKSMGYGNPEDFKYFRKRYEAYLYLGGEFPHEMGLFLGYPLENVVGFMENEGRNYLYTGYWKVYADVPAKISLFTLYEQALEQVISFLSCGKSIDWIVAYYHHNRLTSAC
ncbi:MAG: DUF3793 family protein [Lachnospiraceae bacterium]|nr:DUF3793 family protein [Lachnospiraceae bacterium]